MTVCERCQRETDDHRIKCVKCGGPCSKLTSYDKQAKCVDCGSYQPLTPQQSVKIQHREAR